MCFQFLRVTILWTAWRVTPSVNTKMYVFMLFLDKKIPHAQLPHPTNGKLRVRWFCYCLN